MYDDQKPLVPERIGTYQRVGTSPIGEGGMGVVWLYRETGISSREVAIKFIRVENPELNKANLIKDIKALEKLPIHQNIITMYTVLEEHGDIALVMEYVPGGLSLRSVIREHPSGLPIPMAREILAGILSGMSHAHEFDVIHRDLKPDNILMRRHRVSAQFGRNSVKIVDFGISKVHREGSKRLTTMIAFTEAYAAPEQINAEDTGGFTDVYAIGVLLYEMIAGRKPFEGKIAEIITGHCFKAPPPIARDDIPDGMQAMLDRALKKDPAERYRDAIEMLAEYNTLDHMGQLGAPGYQMELTMPPRESVIYVDTKPNDLDTGGDITEAQDEDTDRTIASGNKKKRSETADPARRKEAEAETEAKIRAEIEARLRAEAEVKIRAEAEASLKAEEDAKRRAEEEARLKAEEEARRRAEEEARRRAEEEARLRAEEDARRRAEEETRRRIEEEIKAKLKAEAEAKRRAEEEAKRKAEEETRLRIEEEIKAKLKAEAEAKRRAEEEARLKAEEEAKARQRAEEETKRRAAEEARRKAEEEALRRAEAEAKQRAEDEARRNAEAEAKAKLKAEQEAKRKEEDEARRKAKEEAKLRAEEETRRKAEEKARRKAEEKALRMAEEEARREAQAIGASSDPGQSPQPVSEGIKALKKHKNIVIAASVLLLAVPVLVWSMSGSGNAPPSGGEKNEQMQDADPAILNEPKTGYEELQQSEAADAGATAGVSSIRLNRTAFTLEIGQTETLRPTFLPSGAKNKNVSWQSSNTSVASVDSRGRVTARGRGAATITATAEDGGALASAMLIVEPSAAERIEQARAEEEAKQRVAAEEARLAAAEEARRRTEEEARQRAAAEESRRRSEEEARQRAAATPAPAPAPAPTTSTNTPVGNTPVASAPVTNTPVTNTPVGNTPAATPRVASAKATVNRLESGFTVRQNQNNLSWSSRELAAIIGSEESAVSRGIKGESGVLDVQIVQGQIAASAVYIFGKAGGVFPYNRVQLIVSGSRVAEVSGVTPAVRADNVRQLNFERAGVDIGFLRQIVNNQGRSMSISFIGADGTKSFDVTATAQRAIAQTLELFDAITALRQAGEPVQSRY